MKAESKARCSGRGSQSPVSEGKTMVRRRGQVGTPARKIHVNSKKGTVKGTLKGATVIST